MLLLVLFSCFCFFSHASSQQQDDWSFPVISDEKYAATTRALIRFGKALRVPLFMPISRSSMVPVRIAGVDVVAGVAPSLGWRSDGVIVSSQIGNSGPCGNMNEFPVNEVHRGDEALQTSVQNPSSTGIQIANSTWLGLICRGRALVGITLPGAGLSGNLNSVSRDDFTTLMADLEIFDLSNNALGGDLSTFIVGPELRTLLLSGNNLQGPIPSDLGVGKLSVVALGAFPLDMMNYGLPTDLGAIPLNEHAALLAGPDRPIPSALHYMYADYRETNLFPLPRHARFQRALASAAVPCLEPDDVVSATNTLCRAAKTCEACLAVQFLGESLGGGSSVSFSSTGSSISGAAPASSLLGSNQVTAIRRGCSPLITRARFDEGEFITCATQADRELYLRNDPSSSSDDLDAMQMAAWEALADEGRLLWGADGLADLEPATDSSGQAVVACASLHNGGVPDPSDGGSSNRQSAGPLVDFSYTPPITEACESLNDTKVRIPDSQCSKLPCEACATSSTCVACADGRGYIGCLPKEGGDTSEISFHLLNFFGGTSLVEAPLCRDLSCKAPVTALSGITLEDERLPSVCLVTADSIQAEIEDHEFCLSAPDAVSCCARSTADSENGWKFGPNLLSIPDGLSCIPCVYEVNVPLGDSVMPLANYPYIYTGCVANRLRSGKRLFDTKSYSASCLRFTGQIPEVPADVNIPSAHMLISRQHSSVCLEAGITAEVYWLESLFGPISVSMPDEASSGSSNEWGDSGVHSSFDPSYPSPMPVLTSASASTSAEQTMLATDVLKRAVNSLCEGPGTFPDCCVDEMANPHCCTPVQYDFPGCCGTGMNYNNTECCGQPSHSMRAVCSNIADPNCNVLDPEYPNCCNPSVASYPGCCEDPLHMAKPDCSQGMPTTTTALSTTTAPQEMPTTTTARSTTTAPDITETAPDTTESTATMEMNMGSAAVNTAATNMEENMSSDLDRCSPPTDYHRWCCIRACLEECPECEPCLPSYGSYPICIGEKDGCVPVVAEYAWCCSRACLNECPDCSPCMPGSDGYPECEEDMGDYPPNSPCMPGSDGFPECEEDMGDYPPNCPPGGSCSNPDPPVFVCSLGGPNFPRCLYDDETLMLNWISHKEAACDHLFAGKGCAKCAMSGGCMSCAGSASPDGSACASKLLGCPGDVFNMTECPSPCAFESDQDDFFEFQPRYVVDVPRFASLSACATCAGTITPSLVAGSRYDICAPCLGSSQQFVGCASTSEKDPCTRYDNSATLAPAHGVDTLLFNETCPSSSEDPSFDYCSFLSCNRCGVLDGGDADLQAWPRNCVRCSAQDGYYSDCRNEAISGPCEFGKVANSPSACGTGGGGGSNCGGFGRSCMECLARRNTRDMCRPCLKLSDRSMVLLAEQGYEIDFSLGDTFCMSPDYHGTGFECIEWATDCENVLYSPGCSGLANCTLCYKHRHQLGCNVCDDPVSNERLCQFEDCQSSNLLRADESPTFGECDPSFVYESEMDNGMDRNMGSGMDRDMSSGLSGNMGSSAPIPPPTASFCQESAYGYCCSVQNERGGCDGPCSPCVDMGSSSSCVEGPEGECCTATNEFGNCDGNCSPCADMGACVSRSFGSFSESCCPPGKFCGMDCPRCKIGVFDRRQFLERCFSASPTSCNDHGCSCCGTSGTVAGCAAEHGRGCSEQGFSHTGCPPSGTCSTSATICSACSSSNCFPCYSSGSFVGCGHNPSNMYNSDDEACYVEFGHLAYKGSCKHDSHIYEELFDYAFNPAWVSSATCSQCESDSRTTPCQLARGYPYAMCVSTLSGTCSDHSMVEMTSCSDLGTKLNSDQTAMDAYCAQWDIPDGDPDPNAKCVNCLFKDHAIDGLPSCRICSHDWDGGASCLSLSATGSGCPSTTTEVESCFDDQKRRRRKRQDTTFGASLSDARAAASSLRESSMHLRRPHNRLTGPLPDAWLSEQNRFVWIDLSFNQFTGKPPSLNIDEHFFDLIWEDAMRSTTFAGSGFLSHKEMINKTMKKDDWMVPYAALLLRGNRFNQLPFLNLSRVSRPTPGADLDSQLTPFDRASRSMNTGGALIDLSCNEIDSQIPGSLVDLTKVDALDLSGNRLHGPIPVELIEQFPFASDENLNAQCLELAESRKLRNRAQETGDPGFLLSRMPRMNLAFNQLTLTNESIEALALGSQSLCLNRPLAQEHALFCSSTMRCNGMLGSSTAYGWTSRSFIDLRCNQFKAPLPATLTSQLHGGNQTCADVIVSPPVCEANWQHHSCSSLSNGSFPGLINFERDCFAADYTKECELCDSGWTSSGSDSGAKPCSLPFPSDADALEELSDAFNADMFKAYYASLSHGFNTTQRFLQTVAVFKSLGFEFAFDPKTVSEPLNDLSLRLNRVSLSRLSRSSCNIFALRFGEFDFPISERLLSLECCKNAPSDEECQAALAKSLCDPSAAFCPGQCKPPSTLSFGTGSEVGSLAALRFASKDEIDTLARRMWRGGGYASSVDDPETAENEEAARFQLFVSSVIKQREEALASEAEVSASFSQCCADNPNDWNCRVADIKSFNIPSQACTDCFPREGRCVPSLQTRCALGNTGPRCLTCPENSFRFGEGCRECGDVNAFVGLLALVALIVLSIVYTKCAKQSLSDIVDRALYLINYLQVLDVVASLHVSLGPLLASLSFLFGWLSFDISAVGIECMTGPFTTPARVALWSVVAGLALLWALIGLIMLAVGELAGKGPLAPGAGDLSLEDSDEQRKDEAKSHGRIRSFFSKGMFAQEAVATRGRAGVRRPPDGVLGAVSKGVFTVLSIIYLPFTRLLASLSLSACEDRTSFTFLFFGDLNCIDDSSWDQSSLWVGLTVTFAAFVPLIIFIGGFIARRAQSRRRAKRRQQKENIDALTKRQILEFDASVRDRADRVFGSLHESYFVPGWDAVSLTYKAALVIILTMHAEQRVRLYPQEHRFSEPMANFFVTLAYALLVASSLPFRYFPLRTSWVTSANMFIRKLTLGNILNVMTALAHTANFLLILATDDQYVESAALPVVVLNFIVIAALVLPIGFVVQCACKDEVDPKLDQHDAYDLSSDPSLGDLVGVPSSSAANPVSPRGGGLASSRSARSASRRKPKSPRTPRAHHHHHHESNEVSPRKDGTKLSLEDE